MSSFVRAPVVRIVDHTDTITVLGPKGARTFSGDSAELVRAVLEIVGTPTTRSELRAELEQRAGEPVPETLVEELIGLLVADGALVAPEPARPKPVAVRRVVLGITGAVAAVDAPALVRGLQSIGCEVRIALSKSAKKFVSIAALEALTHHAVWHGIWHRDREMPVPHINLAEWAELFLVCPASATTLARIATGDCSDLVAAIAAATRAPVVLVPSMNDAMYESPAVQQNLATLRAHGRFLVHPAMGHEVAHAPDERRSLLGPAPPAHALVDIVRHLLAQSGPRVLPVGANAWERLWATATLEQLPWHAESVDGPLATALAERCAVGRKLIDLGTGAGTVAIEAARRGYAVTATDIAASALRRTRERAGALPIQLVLDDITATCIDTRYDVAVDSGLFHCLPRERWDAYAAAIDRLVAPGGALLLVAHQPGTQLATNPVTDAELRVLLPGFEIARMAQTTLSGANATLYELEHRL